MALRLSVLGVPQTQAAVAIAVAATVCNASYSIEAPIISAKCNTAVAASNANYVCQAPTESAKCIAHATVCAADYAVQNSSESGKGKTFPAVCDANYQVYTPGVNGSVQVYVGSAASAVYAGISPFIHQSVKIAVGVCNADYVVQNSSESGKCNEFPAVCNANYVCQAPTESAKCIAHATVCAADYAVQNSGETAKCIVNASVCDAAYAIQNSSESGKCNVFPTVCNANYAVQNSSEIAKCAVYATVCNADYAAQNSSESGKCNVFPTVCNADYAVQNSSETANCIVHATVCNADYAVQTSSETGTCNVYPTVCNADYVVQPVIVNAQANVSTTVSNADYFIYDPKINENEIVVPDPCTAVYSVYDPALSLGCRVFADVCNADYFIHQPIINENEVVFATVSNADYFCYAPVVKANSDVHPAECAGNYSIDNASVSGKCNVYPAVCEGNYTVVDGTQHGQANVPTGTCNADYLCYGPVVKANSDVHPTTCDGNYNAYSAASVTGTCNVYPAECTGVYSVPFVNVNAQANVQATLSNADYFIYDPKINENEVVVPDPCTAVYAAYTPAAFSLSCRVFPATCNATYSVSNPSETGNCRVFATVCNADYTIHDVFIGITIYPASSILELYVSPYYSVLAGGIPNYTDMSKMPNEWLRKCNGMDYENERKLYRKLTTEAYNKFGVCMTYYVVSYDTQYDKIWGEDNNRRFIRKFDIMCRFPLQTEEKMWTKFAIEGIDNFSIFASKDHFRTASTYGHDLVVGNIGRGTFPIYVPKNGDVIQSKYNKYLYEIVTVKEEAMMIHLSKGYTWEFIIKPYMDEHLSVDPAATASLANVSPFIDVNDIFKVNQVVQTEAATDTYTPKSCERPAPNNGGW